MSNKKKANLKFFTDSLARWREGFAVICPQCGIRRHFEDVPKDCYYCDRCGYSQDTKRTCLDQDGKNLIDESEQELLDCYNYLWRINRDKLRWLWLPMIPVCVGLFIVYYYIEVVGLIVGRERYNINEQRH